MKPRLWPALGLIALAGCQSVPMAGPAAAEAVVGSASASPAAIAHRERIARLGLTDGDCAAPDWTMTGRVALSNGKNGGSGRLEWSQAGGKVRIGLSAPVTRQGWVLELDASGATLQGVPDGPVHGRDAGALLRERTGWDIPVAGLGCWVRGAWASEAAFGDASIGYGRDGQVQRIEQAGWTIEYTDWQPDAVSGVELPGRITALRAEDRVRLVVDRWNAE